MALNVVHNRFGSHCLNSVEVARMLGISRSRVGELVAEPHFFAPNVDPPAIASGCGISSRVGRPAILTNSSEVHVRSCPSMEACRPWPSRSLSSHAKKRAS